MTSFRRLAGFGTGFESASFSAMIVRIGYRWPSLWTWQTNGMNGLMKLTRQDVGFRAFALVLMAMMMITTVSENSLAAADIDPLEVVKVPEPTPEAVRFHATGHWIWAASMAISLAVPFAILRTSVGGRIQTFAENHGYGRIGSVITFVVLVSLVTFLIRLPWIFAAGHLRQKAYGLTDQSAMAWFGDTLKAVAVSVAIQCLIATIVWGFLVVRFPKTWWLWTAAGTLPFLIAGIFLTPLVIDPLFNRFEGLKDQELKTDILNLAARAGVADADVFEVDKSRQTKAVNAYVTGLFGSKRVVLWDTLIQKLPPREVRAVVAHELGHYVLGHVRWGVLIGGVSAFGGMFLLDRALRWSIDHWGTALHITRLTDLNAILLLMLLATAGEYAMAPISNAISRTMEKQADAYAIELTRDPAAVANAFATLQHENLSVPYPNWVYRTWRATHPSIGERIEFANSYRPWVKGEPGRYRINFKD